MPTMLDSFFSTLISPGYGSAEFFVAVLVACGLIMIAISSLLPRTASDELEWWER